MPNCNLSCFFVFELCLYLTVKFDKVERYGTLTFGTVLDNRMRIKNNSRVKQTHVGIIIIGSNEGMVGRGLEAFRIPNH